MVIEFYGMPGSGKTTFANDFAKKKYGDVSLINITDKSRTSFWYKVYFKILRTLVKKNKEYLKYRDELIDIVREYRSISAKYNENNVFIDDYVMEMAYDIWTYKKLYEKKKIYIFDEGIVQQIINMCVNYDVDIKTVEKLVDYIKKGKEYRCYYTNSIESTINSIEQRNRHVCFIDELKGKELEDYLNKYNQSCSTLLGLTDSIKINREDDFDYKSDVICKAIGLER
ncbi:MAG: hypothetical protein IJA34_02310 [Lachnospiraceae bacterium]|nr:hypothetical protein [Lachnospiraceae bacterium]